MKNGDWYSFLVHLCQKKSYNIEDIENKPDTFLEEIFKEHIKSENKYSNIAFDIEGIPEVLKTEGVAETGNLMFCRQ